MARFKRKLKRSLHGAEMRDALESNQGVRVFKNNMRIQQKKEKEYQRIMEMQQLNKQHLKALAEAEMQKQNSKEDVIVDNTSVNKDTNTNNFVINNENEVGTDVNTIGIETNEKTL